MRSGAYLGALVVVLVDGVMALLLTRGATRSPLLDLAGAALVWAVLVLTTAVLGTGLVKASKDE
jgi:hypothetical protein